MCTYRSSVEAVALYVMPNRQENLRRAMEQVSKVAVGKSD